MVPVMLSCVLAVNQLVYDNSSSANSTIPWARERADDVVLAAVPLLLLCAATMILNRPISNMTQGKDSRSSSAFPILVTAGVLAFTFIVSFWMLVSPLKQMLAREES